MHIHYMLGKGISAMPPVRKLPCRENILSEGCEYILDSCLKDFAFYHFMFTRFLTNNCFILNAFDDDLALLRQRVEYSTKISCLPI